MDDVDANSREGERTDSEHILSHRETVTTSGFFTLEITARISLRPLHSRFGQERRRKEGYELKI